MPTVLDTQDHVSKPTSARLFLVRLGRLIQPDLHADTLLTHLEHHV